MTIVLISKGRWHLLWVCESDYCTSMLGVFPMRLYWMGSIMPYILLLRCFRMTVIGNFGVAAGDQNNGLERQTSTIEN
jgi:hypothetical protein